MAPPTTVELLERVARLEVSHSALKEQMLMESAHIDEIMALHKQTHTHEHNIHKEAANKTESQVDLRLDQLSMMISNMRDSQAGYVTRETFDTKFGITEKDVATINTVVARLATSTKTERDQNVWWIGILITFLTVGLNILFFVLGT